MRLGDLVRQLTIREGRFDPATPVRGITRDSRQVAPGWLFVAVRGRRTDGHRYIVEAVARGAAAVVLDRPQRVPGAAFIRVPDSRIALAQLAGAWFGQPASDLFLIGVSGTVGKTSTAVMLQRVLEQAGQAVELCGSLRRRPDGSFAHSRFTTPEPLELHGTLRRLADAGVRVAVLEATSHALAQHRLHGVRFQAGVFLNLLPEHLDYHGTFDEYVRVKRRFLGHLDPAAPLVYNLGDERVTALAAGAAGQRRVSFGVEVAGAEVMVHGAGLLATGSRFQLRFPRSSRSYTCHLALLGRQQISNAAAAAATAWALGSDPEQIVRGLEAVPPFYRRLQPVRMGDVTVVDDTAGLPASIAACFEAARPLIRGRVLVVYAIRGSRGAAVAEENARALAAEVRALRDRGCAVTLLITASDDAVDEEDRVSEAERLATLGVLEQGGVESRYLPDLQQAVDEAAARASSGSLILLLGAQGMNSGAALLSRALAWRGRPDRRTPASHPVGD